MATVSVDTSTQVVDYLVSQGWTYKINQNPSERYKGRCPVGKHEGDNTDPKFSVHANGYWFKCWRCSFEGAGINSLKTQMGQDWEPRVNLPKPGPAPVKKPSQGWEGATVKRLCEAKGIDYEYATHALGWKDTLYGRGNTPAVAMPYFDAEGKQIDTRYRVGITRGTRVVSRKGSNALPYGLQNLSQYRAGNYVICVEGETDWATLDEMGYNGFGVPGVNSFKPEWTIHLNGIRTVYVWQESGGTPDRHGRTPGQQMVHRISTYRGEVFVLEAPPEGKDPCELRIKLGEESFMALLDHMMVRAKSYNAVDLAAAERRALNTDPGENVAFKVESNNTINPKGDIWEGIVARGKRRRDQMWEKVFKLFPAPPGVKPWTHSTALWSEKDNHGIAVDMLSNSWKNPANAQFKRQKIYFNLHPKTEDTPLFIRHIPFDDWDKTVHKRMTRNLQRAVKDTMAGWAAFDNIATHGYMLYMTNSPKPKGFTEVTDKHQCLVDALNGISPPGDAEPGRFRPFSGSHNWTAKIESTGEVDRGVYEVVAVSKSPTEFGVLESMCLADGVPTDIKESIWVGQEGSGLAMHYSKKELFVAAMHRMGEQYTLTKAGLAALPFELVLVHNDDGTMEYKMGRKQ